jgi:hypothetical protein
MPITVKEMLQGYRARANPALNLIVTEFKTLAPSDQRELLIWMILESYQTAPQEAPHNGRQHQA